MSAHLGSSTAQEAIHPTDNDVLFSSSDSETDTDDPPRGGDANDGEEIPRTTIADTSGPYHVLIEVLNGPTAGYLEPLPCSEFVRASANQFYQRENRTDEHLRDAVINTMSAVNPLPQLNLVPYGRFVTIVNGNLVQVDDAEAFRAVAKAILRMVSRMEPRQDGTGHSARAANLYADTPIEHPIAVLTRKRRLTFSLPPSSNHSAATTSSSGRRGGLKTHQPPKNSSDITQETAASTVASRSDSSALDQSDHSKGSTTAYQEEDESIHHESAARRPS